MTRPRQPERRILPRLQPRLLLPAALLFLRRHPAMGASPHVGSRWRGCASKDRRRQSQTLREACANNRSRRQRILPRRVYDVVEAEPNVHYILGPARNARLEKRLVPALWQTARKLDADLALCAQAAGAEEAPEVEGTERAFTELRYQTFKSWSCERRVIGKAEITNGKKNPRFIVTDIEPGGDWIAEHEALANGQALYEKLYCGRGEIDCEAQAVRRGAKRIKIGSKNNNSTCSQTGPAPPAATNCDRGFPHLPTCS